MTGLVLKLRPFEKLLVNGAVLQNGARATRLRVRTAGASVLRLRDALHPDKASSPVAQLYYIAQLGIAGEAKVSEVVAELATLIDAVAASAASEEERAALTRAREAAAAGRLYSVMRAVKPLLNQDKGHSPEAV